MSYSFVQSISMHTEPVNVPQRRRDAALSKEMHQRMNALRIVDMVIPKHGVVGNIGPRVPLVAAVHGGELDGVADEEDGQIVEDKVLDAVFRVQLGRPAADVADRVGGALLAAHGRDAHQQPRLLANAAEELGVRQVRHVVEDLELAKGARGLGVDAPVLRQSQIPLFNRQTQHGDGSIPFGDALTRKVCENFYQLDICQHDQAAIGIAIANLPNGSGVVAWLALIYR